MNGKDQWKQLAQAAYKQQMREEYPYDRFVTEGKIYERLQRGQQKRQRQRMLWATAVLCVCLMLAWISWRHVEEPMQREETLQPPVHSLQYLEPDQGYLQALAQGYPVLSSPQISKDGLTFEVKEAIMDAQRLNYVVLISGEEIEEMARKQDDGQEEEAFRQNLVTKPEVVGSMMTGYPREEIIQRDGRHYFVAEAESIFYDPADIEKQLLQQHKELPIIVTWGEDPDHKVILPLKLPEQVKDTRILEGKPYPNADTGVGQIVSGGKPQITQWVMSPTVVRVDLTGTFQNGRVLKSLENIKLTDDTGKTYQSLSGAQKLGDTHVFYFTPSPYFAQMEQKQAASKVYHLRFTGYSEGTVQENTYTLTRNAAYPKQYTLGDQTRVDIKEVAWGTEDKLLITMAKVPDDGQFYVTIDGVEANQRMDKGQTTTFAFPVPQKNQYQMSIQHTKMQTHPFDGDLPFYVEGEKE